VGLSRTGSWWYARGCSKPQTSYRSEYVRAAFPVSRAGTTGRCACGDFERERGFTSQRHNTRLGPGCRNRLIAYENGLEGGYLIHLRKADKHGQLVGLKRRA
jgi:hypothetical protein